MDFPIAVIYRSNNTFQETSDSENPCATVETSLNKKVYGSEGQPNLLPSTGMCNEAFEIETATDVVSTTADSTFHNRTIPQCTCGENSLRKKKPNRITMKSTKEFFRSISSSSVNVLEFIKDPSVTTEKAIFERYKEKPELRRTISCTTDSSMDVMLQQFGFFRSADPYILRSDPDSCIIDVERIHGLDVEEPPPSYESLACIFIKDEPPKYEVVTGKKLAMDLIENKPRTKISARWRCRLLVFVFIVFIILILGLLIYACFISSRSL